MEEATEQEVGILESIKLIKDNLKLIVIITSLFFLLSVLYATTATKVYSSETLMSPTEDLASGSNSSQLGGISQFITGASSIKTDIAIALVKSRSFAKEFIEEEKMKKHFFPDQWSEEGSWLHEEPSDWDAYKVYEGILAIDQDLKTSFVTLSVRWSDPFLTAEWVNKLSKKLNLVMSIKDYEKAERNLSNLNAQVGSTSSVELKEAIYFLIQKEAEKKMLASSSENYVFYIIDPGVIPLDKVAPKRSLIVLSSTVIGFLFSTFFVVLRRYFTYQSQLLKESQ